MLFPPLYVFFQTVRHPSHDFLSVFKICSFSLYKAFCQPSQHFLEAFLPNTFCRSSQHFLTAFRPYSARLHDTVCQSILFTTLCDSLQNLPIPAFTTLHVGFHDTFCLASPTLPASFHGTSCQLARHFLPAFTTLPANCTTLLASIHDTTCQHSRLSLASSQNNLFLFMSAYSSTLKRLSYTVNDQCVSTV
jgi:hypothetical protein